jgi:DeoR/GlpR family transcriptional regulator of sugar metabolism
LFPDLENFMPDPDIFHEERLVLIEAKLRSEGRVSAAHLASEFEVSVDTIRRDLRELAAGGRCQRVYGGALPPAPRTGTYQQRRVQMLERKRLLGQASARLVAPGSVVFIDAGTTNLAIVAAMPSDTTITLVTNAPAIAAFALDRPAWRLIQIGGVVDIGLGAALGAAALRDLAAISPDLAFIGVCGFDLAAGATAHSLEEAEFKRQVAARSREVAVALTDDKLLTQAPFPAFAASVCTHAVFESTISSTTVAAIGELGVNTIVADAN